MTDRDYRRAFASEGQNEHDRAERRARDEDLFAMGVRRPPGWPGYGNMLGYVSEGAMLMQRPKGYRPPGTYR